MLEIAVSCVKPFVFVENTYEDVAPSKATQNKSLSSPANKTQVGYA